MVWRLRIFPIEACCRASILEALCQILHKTNRPVVLLLQLLNPVQFDQEQRRLILPHPEDWHAG